MTNAAFLERLADRSATMVFHEAVDPSDERTVLHVRHRLGDRPSADSRATVEEAFGNEPGLGELRRFYVEHDGADVCVVADDDGNPVPLLRLLSVAEWGAATAARQAGGDLDWNVDLNSYKKVRTLYRGTSRWLAFAATYPDVGVLTTFLDGPDAGKIFYLTPEPGWNIAKPLFPSFAALYDALASDMAAVFRRLRIVSPDGIRAFKYEADGQQ